MGYEMLKNPMAKCLYWGLILVLLILTWWYLTSKAEHLGEWSSALLNQENHFRLMLGKNTIDNGGQEWGDALLNQDEHDRASAKSRSEYFQGRRPMNVDTRENEFRKIMEQVPMPKI